MLTLIVRYILLAALLLPVTATGERIRPADMTPVISVGHTASDPDERGLWQSSDKIEKSIADSNLLIRDANLSGYIDSIIERLLGDAAADVRVYIIRDPNFNASMFPNGMMLVHTGLLARMRNEAQLAAVLGHEAGHYFRQHTLSRWRSQKTKTAVMSIFSVAGAAATGVSGNNWYDVANAINASLLLSIFSYSREQESEADAYGVRLLAEAGYSPHAAANVWGQLIDERKASARARDKRYKDRSLSAFSTHPPSSERMKDLAISADELIADAGDDADFEFHTGREKWLDGINAYRWLLLEEQIKLNDDGASIYLINALAQDGWNSGLHYYLGKAYSLRGKPGDEELAAESYAVAVSFDDPLPLALRAHGYAEIKKGNTESGRAALSSYLQLQPDAPDAAMIRFSINQ